MKNEIEIFHLIIYSQILTIICILYKKGYFNYLKILFIYLRINCVLHQLFSALHANLCFKFIIK